MIQIALEAPGRFIATDCAPPVQAPGEALVRVHRIGVCGTDLHAFAGRQPFFTYPRILGHELGVEVIEPGSEPHGLNPATAARSNRISTADVASPVAPADPIVAPG